MHAGQIKPGARTDRQAEALKAGASFPLSPRRSSCDARRAWTRSPGLAACGGSVRPAAAPGAQELKGARGGARPVSPGTPAARRRARPAPARRRRPRPRDAGSALPASSREPLSYAKAVAKLGPAGAERSGPHAPQLRPNSALLSAHWRCGDLPDQPDHIWLHDLGGSVSAKWEELLLESDHRTPRPGRAPRPWREGASEEAGGVGAHEPLEGAQAVVRASSPCQAARVRLNASRRAVASSRCRRRALPHRARRKLPPSSRRAVIDTLSREARARSPGVCHQPAESRGRRGRSGCGGSADRVPEASQSSAGAGLPGRRPEEPVVVPSSRARRSSPSGAAVIDDARASPRGRVDAVGGVVRMYLAARRAETLAGQADGPAGIAAALAMASQPARAPQQVPSDRASPGHLEAQYGQWCRPR